MPEAGELDDPRLMNYAFLIGYIAIPRLHEATCPYRKNPDRAICACRIGLWQRVKPRVRVKARSVAFSRQEHE